MGALRAALRPRRGAAAHDDCQRNRFGGDGMCVFPATILAAAGAAQAAGPVASI